MPWEQGLFGDTVIFNDTQEASCRSSMICVSFFSFCPVLKKHCLGGGVYRVEKGIVRIDV